MNGGVHSTARISPEKIEILFTEGSAFVATPTLDPSAIAREILLRLSVTYDRHSCQSVGNASYEFLTFRPVKD